MCSSDLFAVENLKPLLNENLNAKIYTTFKTTFSNINLDSVSKITHNVCKYNNEIDRFIQNINVKYDILLEFTVLEIPDVFPFGRHSRC